MGEDCIFCKIIRGEMESEKLHEDDFCVIIKDKFPDAATHLLVLPKKHIPTIADMEEGDERFVGHMVREAKMVAERLGLKGYKLLFNVGKEGGQVIFHVHLHIMSKFS